MIKLVTSVTGRRDTLTDSDYRDIYTELRETYTLAAFIARTGSQVSRSWWSQYEAGAKKLDWQRKNELRRAVGLPELDPPILDAIATTAEAEVWQVGETPADRVLLLSPEVSHSTIITLNGRVSINDLPIPVKPVSVAVTPVTLHPRTTVGIGGIRPTTRSRLADLRRGNETWDALLLRLAHYAETARDDENPAAS